MVEGMRLRHRQRAVGVGHEMPAVDREGELLERLGLRGVVRSRRRERRHERAPRAAGVRGHEIEHRAQRRHRGRRVERRGRAGRHEIGARRVGRPEEREPARLQAAADGEEERRNVRPAFAFPRAADFALHVAVREFVDDGHRRGRDARNLRRLRRGFRAEQRFRRIAVVEGRLRGRGSVLRVLRVIFLRGMGLRVLCVLCVLCVIFLRCRSLRGRSLRGRSPRVGFEHVNRLAALRGAPFLHERRIGHQLDAGAVFGFRQAGARRIAHRLEDGAVVAVVVGRAEKFSGHAAARDGRVFALGGLDLDFAFLENVGEVGGELVVEQRLGRAREPAARRALVETFVLVRVVELQAHERGRRVLEKERHEIAQRNRTAALLHLAGDEPERLVVGQETDFERCGLARRTLSAEGRAVAAEGPAVAAEGPVVAERRAFAAEGAFAAFRVRPETAGAVLARRTVSPGRAVAERVPVSARRTVAPESAAIAVIAAAVAVVARGEAFRVFAEVCGVRRRVLFRPVRGKAEVRQKVVLVVGVAFVHGSLRSGLICPRGGGRTPEL